MRLKAQFYSKLGLTDLSEDDAELGEKLRKRSGSGLSDKRANLSTGVDTRGERTDSAEDVSVEGKIHKILKVVISELKVRGGNLPGMLAVLDKAGLTKLEMQEMLSTSWMDGWTAVHYATFYGKNVILKEFMERGADINILTLDGWTPLLLAINRKSVECTKILLASKYIQLNFPSPRGTALHLAVKNGDVSMVQLLLNHGADIHMKDPNGRCVYDYDLDQDMFMTLEQIRSGGESIKVEEFDDPEEEKQMAHINLGETEQRFRPTRPPLIRGRVYKFGGYFFRHFRRYLVLDAKEGTLIRYETIDDFPMKPM